MAKHPGCMVKVEQNVNDVVHVPPDWLHHVSLKIILNTWQHGCMWVLD